MAEITNPTVQIGQLNLAVAASKIVAGATSLSLRNNANTADNILVADSGAVTFRSTVGGITTLTATTLAGTLSTAAQPNVTSVGTLTSLTTSGNVTAGATAGFFWTGRSRFVSNSDGEVSVQSNAGAAANLVVALLTASNGITVSAGTTAVQALTATGITATTGTFTGLGGGGGLLAVGAVDSGGTGYRMVRVLN